MRRGTRLAAAGLAAISLLVSLVIAWTRGIQEAAAFASVIAAFPVIAKIVGVGVAIVGKEKLRLHAAR